MGCCPVVGQQGDVRYRIVRFHSSNALRPPPAADLESKGSRCLFAGRCSGVKGVAVRAGLELGQQRGPHVAADPLGRKPTCLAADGERYPSRLRSRRRGETELDRLTSFGVAGETLGREALVGVVDAVWVVLDHPGLRRKGRLPAEQSFDTALGAREGFFDGLGAEARRLQLLVDDVLQFGLVLDDGRGNGVFE